MKSSRIGQTTNFQGWASLDLKALNDAVQQSKKPLPLLKTALAAFKEAQREAFSNGTAPTTLIKARSDFIDQILTLCWQRFSWDENLSSLRKSRISLVAVGGYGRSELLPNSDIDLLILTERGNARQHTSNIQSFLTLLWDIGLEVGHSVRSVQESLQQARLDVTVTTALLDARNICGTPKMLNQLSEKLRTKAGWKSATFFSAKADEQKERHAKSNHTEYSLEPNLKTSPGGLRDIQTILWIANFHYRTDQLEQLVLADFLEEAEARLLSEAQAFLWKVRFVLHDLYRRDENRLLFEHQRKVAQQLGYADGDQLAVEQFMQDYYRFAKSVSTINEIVLQHFEEVVFRPRLVRKPVVINNRFQSNLEHLEVTHSNVFEQHPEALLEMFILLGETPELKGIRAGTIRLAQAAAAKIDDDFRANPVTTALFLKLLRVEFHLFSQLRRMNRYGVLGAYLPEFERVVGQMQFDLFHIYTVDAHTLQVVRNMRRFRYKNQEQRFPIAAHIHHRLPKIELLYLAGFFHDLAKGQGGDHSELGIDIARRFCERHQLGMWDTNLVCWLVKNHLLMSTTAQRKDIFDPDVIKTFAEEMGDQVRLDYLYALTVADINATNPDLWNSWRASLMTQLYLETKRVLRMGVENMVDRDDYLEQVQASVIRKLSEKGLDPALVERLWAGLDDDYFLRESEQNIIWHTESLYDYDLADGPLILIGADQSRLSQESDAIHIFIHARYTEPVFYAVVAAFEDLGMNIVDARIPSNTRGRTDYTFDVLDTQTNDDKNLSTRTETIRATLAKAIKAGDSFRIRPRRTPRQLKEFKLKTTASYHQDPSSEFTVLEVLAADRPGLLAKLARLFSDHDVQILAAKITTLGERVEDVFHIVGRDGEPILHQDTIENLCVDIRSELDQHIQRLTA
ncbi:MAG: [protein-PII] uridylyltransferase [Proteobacteria bacterium]|nr:[protein-PII] uridylyltransferase [Pseudomonadota bacterium]